MDVNQTIAFDDEVVTVTNAAIGVTDATAGIGTKRPARRAFCTVEGAGIRFRYDGTAATALIGHPVPDGGSFSVEGTANIDQLSMFRSSGTDASVHITYER